MELLLSNYITRIDTQIDALKAYESPEGLYAPIHYLLKLGGKRIRPAVTLMTADLLGGNLDKITPAAVALEVFHNFTLMHDDIMDNAPLRRGEVTVHEKWDINTAILSGDGMMILAYKLLEEVDDMYYKPMMRLFNQTAIEVCEGQQHDMDFEQRQSVSHEEYVEMIRLKTSVLLACCFQTGALLSDAKKSDQEHLYHFGELLGIAFQLKDDWLDVFGDHSKVGKQAGGDILANKKTFLLIRALEKANPTTKADIEKWLNTNDQPEEKVKAITSLFLALEIDKDTESEIDKYYKKALLHLDALGFNDQQKSTLQTFAEQLMGRVH